MKFSACEYNFFSTSLPVSKYERKTTEKLEIFFFIVFFFKIRMDVAVCLQAVQTAEDRSFTIVMSWTKGAHRYSLA